jgi:hypothetical protein
VPAKNKWRMLPLMETCAILVLTAAIKTAAAILILD